MADLVFKISPDIILGSYCASRIGTFAKERGSRFMLILDPVLKAQATTNAITESLTSRDVEFFVFDEAYGTPDTELINRALELARDAHIHGVIAVGGTAVQSVAQAMCAVYHEVHDLYTFVDGSKPMCAPLPLLSIPSTIRSIFLFTDTIPVVDSRNRQLRLLNIQSGLCRQAIFDPNLYVSLTDNQLSSITLETLCLAVDALVSQKATFFSDMLAEKSLEILGQAVHPATQMSVSATREMLLAQGGCLVSLATAVSAPGPAVLIGLSAYARHNIAHALITTILFPYYIECFSQYKADRIQKVARILRLEGADGSPEAAVAACADFIRQKIAVAKLPSRLKDLELTMDQLSLVAEDAGQLDLMNGLSRSMTADDLFELIKKAY